MITQVNQQGGTGLLGAFRKKMGGKAHVQPRVLAKKGAGGKTGEVPV